MDKYCKNELTKWFMKMATLLSHSAKQGTVSLEIKHETTQGLLAITRTNIFNQIKEIFGDDFTMFVKDDKRYAVLQVSNLCIIMLSDDLVNDDIEFMFVKDVEIGEDESGVYLSFTPDSTDEMRSQIQHIVRPHITEFMQILHNDAYVGMCCTMIAEMKQKLGEDGFAELLERLDEFRKEKS